MRKGILFIYLSVFVLLQPLFSQNRDFIRDCGQSIATTDNVFTPIVNPAGLGYGNSGGLGVLQLWDKEKMRNHYWLIANLDGLSYSFEYKKNDVKNHIIAIGSETFGVNLLPNFYSGSSYKWKDDDFEKGCFNTGFLFRPKQFLSVGFTFDNPYKRQPLYQFGLGIRPLAVIPTIQDNRLVFSIDMSYNKIDDDNEYSSKYKLKKPIIGIGTELIDGIVINGNYNLETKSTMLNFSLKAKKLQVGSLAHAKSNDNYGIVYSFFSSKEYLPFAGIKENKWYQLPLQQTIVTYKAPSYTFGPFKIYDDKEVSVETIIKEIDSAKSDPNVSGLIFINKNFTASLALKQEIIQALKDFKQTGKKIVFYYDNMSNGDYIFASSVADKIYLNPQGSVDLKGIAINSFYLKETLEKIGINVYNFRSHPTKTAGNMFSESEMIPEERAMYEWLLTNLYNQICNLISEGRGEKLKQKSIKEIIDKGPYYLAKDALDAGLVDELIYQSELDNILKRDFKTQKKVTALSEYVNLNWAHPRKTKVAIIYAQGNIVMGKGTVGKIVASETTAELIRKARKDDKYKAIILRIDSGGGSGQASDIIYHEIELAKKENNKKVVTSMAGVAGSGGYYIASNSDYILAEPTTITGSIGVIGLTFSAERLYKKFGVNWGTVKKGEHSDIGTTTRSWTEEEKKYISNLVENFYNEFVNKVAKDRKKTPEEIDTIAQGKVWTGEQALNIGLIDGLGGIKEAVSKIKEIANIRGEVELEEVRSDKKGIEMGVNISAMKQLFPYSKTLKSFEEILNLYEKYSVYQNEKVLYMMIEDLSELSQ